MYTDILIFFMENLNNVLGSLMISFLLVVVYSKVNNGKNQYKTGFNHNEEGKINAQNEIIRNVLRRRHRGIDLQRPLYPNGWIPLIPSSKVKSGQSLAVTALGQELMVFRGNGGKAFVLNAYCPHMGTHLGVGGKVVNDCIECPFHGWKFDGETGICIDIPYSNKIPSAAKVRSWHTRELLNFIFIWYHSDSENPSWEIPEIEEINSKKWTLKGKNEHTIFTHIQDISENTADEKHFNQVHSEFSASGLDQNSFSNKILANLRHLYKTKWYPGPAPNEHIAYNDVVSELSIINMVLPFKFQLHFQQIGPALTYIKFKNGIFKGVLVMFVTPEGPLQQKAILCFFGDWRLPNIFAWMLLYSENKQFERENEIWNNKRFLKTQLITKEESSLLRHRQWFSQFYTINSVTLKDVDDMRLEW